MKGSFRVGVSLLTIASGILTALSSVPLLYLPYGTVRGENFIPVSGLGILIFVLAFVIEGLLVAAEGFLILFLPRWTLVWSGIALALSANNIRVNFTGSSILVIAALIGAFGGLLGVLWKLAKTSGLRLNRWQMVAARTFPFAVLGVGLWEFSGTFLSCAPTNGIGTGGCELLGPTFYVMLNLGLATVFSALSIPVAYALDYARPKPQYK